MSDLSSLRVADADREQLVEELREHTVAGRLTSDELEEPYPRRLFLSRQPKNPFAIRPRKRNPASADSHHLWREWNLNH